MHSRPDEELEALVTATVIDEGTWVYCPVCGMELSLMEPDADTAWREACNAKVKAEGLRGLGLL